MAPIQLQKSVEERRNLVAYLVQAGFDHRSINRLLGVPCANNDILWLRRHRHIPTGQLFANESARYAALVRWFAKHWLRLGEPAQEQEHTPMPLEALIEYGEQALLKPHMKRAWHARANHMRDVCRPPYRRPPWCADLLDAAFPLPEPSECVTQAVRTVMQSVVTSTDTRITSCSALDQEVRRQLCDIVRAHVWPDWPCENDVLQLVTSALEQLSARDARILRKAYEHKRSLARIADEYSLSPERVAQLRQRDLRRLRADAPCRERLAPLIAQACTPSVGSTQPVSATATEVDERRLMALSQSISHLELPGRTNPRLDTRARNGLEYINALSIADVCVLRESDLLKIKNFGRVSLEHVKEALEYFGRTQGVEHICLGLDPRSDADLSAALAYLHMRDPF